MLSASLWNSTILPGSTLLVTLWQILSAVAVSFQSRESTLDIKVKSFYNKLKKIIIADIINIWYNYLTLIILEWLT